MRMLPVRYVPPSARGCFLIACIGWVACLGVTSANAQDYPPTRITPKIPVPVQIESVPEPRTALLPTPFPSPVPPTRSSLPASVPVPKPSTFNQPPHQKPTAPVPVRQTPSAVEQFDILSEEELSASAEEDEATAADASATLAPATKARMFNWREEDHYRAGCPQLLRHFNIPSANGRYTMYKVGGGSALFGSGPMLSEGTWGLDYAGFLLPRKIALNWNHGKREQGGTGAYKTDGPKLGE